MAKSTAEKVKQVERLRSQAATLRASAVSVDRVDLVRQKQLVPELEHSLMVARERLDNATEELAREQVRLDAMIKQDETATVNRQEADALERQATDLSVEIALAEAGMPARA